MAANRSIESVAVRQRRNRAGTTIPVGERQMYGVFGPQYGAYLAASASDTSPTASAAEAAGSAAALRMGADNEANAYAQMLSRAQDLQVDAQKRDILAEAYGDVAERRPGYFDKGAGNIESVLTTPEGEFGGFGVNDTQTRILNNLSVNDRRAETTGKFATANETMQKGGYGLTLPAKRKQLRDPITGEEADLQPMLNPDDELAAMTTETPEEKYHREATVAQINADLKGEAKVEHLFNENGDDMGLKWTGPWSAVQRGMADMRAQGFDPGTGKYIGGTAPPPASPKAGAKGGVAPATAAAVSNDWKDYRSPKYDAVEAGLEEKYHLPKGLMRRIRVHGEKSNADRVSSAGARTVYQVTPPTRARIFERHGVDAWSSPQAAAEAAAIHLSDSIRRGQDPVLEYNAGPRKRGAWGSKEAREYKARVDGPQAHASVAQADPDVMRIRRYKANPLVADAARDNQGNIVVTMKSGRKMVFNKGRQVG